jgi:predicted peptidase
MAGKQPTYRLVLYAILALLLAWVGARQVYRHLARVAREREAARALAAFSEDRFTTQNGYELPYRLLLPASYDPHQTYPLLLFLHGVGECGRENRRPVAWLGTSLLQPAFREAYPCFVLVPQCPPAEDWAGDNQLGERYHKFLMESDALKATLALIDTLARRYPIDRRRLYVSGFSMGGSGVWDLLERHPGLFAAGMAVSGYTDPWAAPRLQKTPVWIFHSTKDAIVPVQESREMATALRRAGGLVRYTEYGNTPHNCWRRVVKEPGVFAWLFDQRLPEKVHKSEIQ